MPIQPIIRGHSEIHPSDDYKGKNFPIFANLEGGRTPEEIKDWASDTHNLATYSVWSYLVELPIKIASYFVSCSDYSETFWRRGICFAERLTGTFGDMFRNLIYAHKTKAGKRDDDIGGELLAEGIEEEDSALTLPVINNHLQTKGRFLTTALSLISPTLANDLDWGLIHALDSWWWRNLSTNISFGPGFRKKILDKLFGETQAGEINWKLIKNKFKDHLKGIKESWNKLHNSTSDENTIKNKLDFYGFIDKTISSFMPIVNVLNLFGDITRPIARRLGIEGFPRNLIRIFSVIDRPFAILTNLFRYYLPERIIQSTRNKDANSTSLITPPNILLTSFIGEAIDFGSIALEDTIKSSNSIIQHTVEIARRITGTLLNTYFSARRQRPH